MKFENPYSRRDRGWAWIAALTAKPEGRMRFPQGFRGSSEHDIERERYVDRFIEKDDRR